MRLAHEISKREHGLAIESERRRTAERETSQLKSTVQQLQVDNEKLEKHISEWKLIAEESKSNADIYCREMNKVFTALEEVKLGLPWTCTEEHLQVASLAPNLKRSSVSQGGSIAVVDRQLAELASDFKNLNCTHAISYKLSIRVGWPIQMSSPTEWG